MKEYLIKNIHGEYKVTDHHSGFNVDDLIEIPEWANYAYKNDLGACFTRQAISRNHPLLIWQRATHPEPLPFIDDNPQSLNDQYAEIEQVRQNQKTINAMREAEGILGKKHSHYRKSVKHLDFIDPYRIAQLYGLHSCADHIAKKALCTGKRGHKDLMRDIQDIIDTAERWKQMIQEDQNAI